MTVIVDGNMLIFDDPVTKEAVIYDLPCKGDLLAWIRNERVDPHWYEQFFSQPTF